MKRLIFGLVLVALVSQGCKKNPFVIQLYAQSFPTTVHAQWTPNVAADNVVQYRITLGANPAITVLPASCSPTLCSQVLNIPSAGNYSVSLVAQNLRISTDPTSLQNSPASVIPFNLNLNPNQVSGGTVVTP